MLRREDLILLSGPRNLALMPMSDLSMIIEEAPRMQSSWDTV